MKFHQMSVEEALRELKTQSEGIDEDEARFRLDLYGPNELVEKSRKTALMMLLSQFTDFMIIVLVAAALISKLIGDLSDAIVILVIVVLNAVLGFIQEFRAERAVAALKKMAASSASVIRGGMRESVPAAQIVPGDIVELDAGKIVPADMRLIEARGLSVEEAALTGESLPVQKETGPITDEDAALSERKNIAYKGTFITHGRGIGAVTATGMESEVGKIAALIQREEEGKTPLQKRLASFGTRLAYGVLAICAVIFIGGLLRGEEPVRIFLVAVSLAVAAIPEALPAVVTISLAIGAHKMVKQNALIRKLGSVETLGSVTYICTDKTGTLTQNRMTVEEVWVDGKTVRSEKGGGRRGKIEAKESSPYSSLFTPYGLLMTAMALSNDAHLDASGEILGEPTEAALFAAAREWGFQKQKLEVSLPRVAELSFDPARKLMTTVHEIRYGAGSRGDGEPATDKTERAASLIRLFPGAPRSRFVSLTKGAIEVLVNKSRSILTSDGEAAIDVQQVLRVADRLAREGQRVIGVGMRLWDEMPASFSHDVAEEKIVLLGLVGMIDPLRPEVLQAVALCKTAGITPVMITGDHPLTAAAVARKTGILETDKPGAIITGTELEKLQLGEFEKRVGSIRVYARVAPEQKLKIVRALQDKGEYVAMTGDGVNDAPALKRAEIGVAMGITGTDVAKEAASMILLDDNFATIVKAVKEGRRIYDNIRKFVKYLLSTNSGEIWALFLAPFFGLPIPLQPIHILWINLLTDGLPALALSLEPEEGEVMERPPRHPSESIFAHGLGIHAIWVGLLMAAVVLSIQAWEIHIGDAHWQTMVFTLLCLLQLGHVLAIRSECESLFAQGILSNKPLLLAVVLTIFLQLMTVYMPALNPIFKTEPLSISELLVVLALSTFVFCGVEIEKYFKRRGRRVCFPR